ncbi:MAG: tail fiber domain-containing protein [Burkholderiales bacterium]
MIEGAVPFTSVSDRREKKDIRDISLGLEFVMALHPVEYRMRNGNGRLDLGFVAQDIESLLGTGYNLLGIGAAPDRKLSLRYTDLVAPMVRAIQQQQSTIERQQAAIAELRRAVELLLARTSPEGRIAVK